MHPVPGEQVETQVAVEDWVFVMCHTDTDLFRGAEAAHYRHQSRKADLLHLQVKSVLSPEHLPPTLQPATEHAAGP